MVELVDTRDLKSLASNGVPVQVRLRVPFINMCKVIVFDRDGTLIKHIPYLHDPSKVILLPGVKESFNLIFKNKIKVFIHTNQSGINRNFFTLEEAKICNEALFRLLNIKESEIEGICIAPEMPNEKSIYRKPSNAFGIKILQQLSITPNELYYVGDSICDLETALNLNCHGIGVNTGMKNLEFEIKKNPNLAKFPIYNNLLNAVTHIINE